ncbi:MAG TPA: DUF350 domain-containing protein [Bacteroidales bacterium]|nr:DUF350 domain-containing protein [Bacteroidales bacterium]
MNLNLQSHHKFFFWIILVGAAALIGLSIYAVAFSTLGFAFAKAVIGLVLFWLFDRYVMKEVDTFTELKKGNVAYALFLVAIALVLAATIATG